MVWPIIRRLACAAGEARWLAPERRAGAAHAWLRRPGCGPRAGFASGRPSQKRGRRKRGALRVRHRRRSRRACAGAHLAHGAPIGYYSLELLLSYEVSSAAEQQLKAQERALSRQAEFVVVQDEARGRLLAEDNDLAWERLVLVPNAPPGQPDGDPQGTGTRVSSCRRRRAWWCTPAVSGTGPASRPSSIRQPTGQRTGCWSSTRATTPSPRRTSTICAPAPMRGGCGFRFDPCRARTTIR